MKKIAVCWLIYFIICMLFITPVFQQNPKWMYDVNNLFKYSINIILFKNIIYYISGLRNNSINTNIVISFFIRNILIGMPLGVLIPLTFKNINFKKILLMTILISFSLEVVSFVLKVGVIDIDALLIRLIGSLIVYSIIKNISQLNNFIINFK